MSTPATRNVLRPGPGGFKAKIMAWVMERVPFVFRLLRAFKPIVRFGNTVVVTRYDDVREVFLNNEAFHVPYHAKLMVITGNQPFFLSMDDPAAHNGDTEALRKVVLKDDIDARLAPDTERLAETVVAGARGELEVVDALVRRVTFDVYGKYFGITAPPGKDLTVWATRLFEFQFVDGGNDPALKAEVDVIAPALRAHIDDLIASRRKSGTFGDDVLGRCLKKQHDGDTWFTDGRIRTALMGCMVGGPPQPPMVVPQVVEQLLRRPEALEGAQEAALANDDKLLAGYVFEAMRFDPLAPALQRTAAKDSKREEITIAAGMPRATKVPKGATVFVAFSSAMMDDRRIPHPRRFDPRRLDYEYMNFGYGMHECFGVHMNKALLPLLLKPLLKRSGLRRAPGPAGHLTKRGAFSDRLTVNYD